MQVGLVIQHLCVLLELDHTILTLRIGQSPIWSILYLWFTCLISFYDSFCKLLWSCEKIFIIILSVHILGWIFCECWTYSLHGWEQIVTPMMSKLVNDLRNLTFGHNIKYLRQSSISWMHEQVRLLVIYKTSNWIYVCISRI